MCFLVAGILILQTEGSTKTCQLVRREKKTSDECFSEPECMERCGVLKGDNCKVQEEKQCKTEYKKQCSVVEEKVGEINI